MLNDGVVSRNGGMLQVDVARQEATDRVVGIGEFDRVDLDTVFYHGEGVGGGGRWAGPGWLVVGGL